MNLKTLLKLGKVALFAIMLSAVAFGQTTYFVDVVNGLDGYNGLSETVTGTPGVGPKQTIQNAIAAASDGDIISVAYASGNLYNEAVILTDKTLTFISTGGTPNVYSFEVDVDKAVMDAKSPVQPDDVTFTGPFKFTTGLTLTDGDLLGGGQVTAAGTVTRKLGTVDAQLLYSGVVNFNYTTGAAVTSGYELPAADNTTNFGNLTTTGAATALTLNSSKTMNGTLSTAGTLDLGTFTLNIAGSNAHTVGAAVSNGTVAFDLDGAASVGGAFTLPNVIATTDATARTLTLTNATAVEDITANAKATIDVAAAVAVDNVINNGSGNVDLNAAIATKSLSNLSSGKIFTGALASLTVTGNILQSGTGSVDLDNTAGTIIITGTVTNNPTITLASTVANKTAASKFGGIYFPDQTNTITGKVTNAAVITGTNGTANSAHVNIGEIRFANTTTVVTLTGGLDVASANTGLTKGTGSLDIQNSGSVYFANTTGNILIPGDINLTGSWEDITSTTNLGNGSIYALNRTTGDFGNTSTRTGDIVNSSVATNGANCNLQLGVAIASASTANPVVVTTTTPHGLVVGDAVQITTTGAEAGGALDGTSVTVTAATATTFTVAFDNSGGATFTGAIGSDTDGLIGKSVSTSGADGGYINLGNTSLNLSGSINNSRTVAGDHINVGAIPYAAVTIQVGGNVNNMGKSNINFDGFDGGAGNETFSVTGALMSSGTGSIEVAPTAALSGTGAFSIGSIDLVSGTIDLQGAAGAVMEVVVNGNSNFAGGKLDVGTSVAPAATIAALPTTPVVVAAANRVLQLGGLNYTFSTASGTTDFTANTNTVLYVSPTAIVAHQTIIGNAATTVWPGVMVVKNSTGLQPGITFEGGNFRVLSHLAFDNSEVKLDGINMFVGGQLAPNIGAGNFYNHPGYTTANNAFISINGNAVATVGGAGTFENFEVDADDRADADYTDVVVTVAASTGAFKSKFNLTAGTVNGGVNIVFNNTNPYPTIVRNAGVFGAAPTFTSMVNVYYIGLDKVSALELPGAAATTKLNNLTIATTNGAAVAGQGVVNVGVAATINGTLNVFPGQTLLIDGVSVTMKGDTVLLDGDIANVATADKFVLAATNGTKIIGARWLPDINVAASSVGNIIDGARGLVTGFLGADKVRGGTIANADFDATTTEATGDLTFITGTNSLVTKFGTGAKNGTNLELLVTAGTGNTLQVSSNMIQASNFTHANGTITVDSAMTWVARGLAHSISNTAVIGGKGLLQFTRADDAEDGGVIDNNIDLTATGNDATIDIDIELNHLDAGATNPEKNLILKGFDFTFTGDLTLTKGILDLTNKNLDLTGKNFTMVTGTSVAGTNILTLNATAANAPLIWSFTGTTTAVSKVTVANDVQLAGTGTKLTVGTAFLHSAGNFDFADRNIVVTGTYNRTTGTYAATDGYLVINNATFNQGATGFSIPNLMFGDLPPAAAAAVSPTFGQAGVVTVTKNLALNINPAANLVTHTVTSAKKLTVADSANVIYFNGEFDATPTYAGGVDMYLYNPGVQTISAKIWPTALNVRNLVVNNAGALTLAGDASVASSIYYTAGTVNVPTTKTLTVADSALIKVDAGALTLTGTGAVSYGNGIDVMYVPSAAGYVSTGVELPATVNNLSFTRLGNTVNRTTTLNTPVTVDGTLLINNNLTTTALIAPITLNGDLVVGKDAFTNATTPTTTFGSALTFAGTADTKITVPSTGATIGAIALNKTAGTNTITLEGGNLTTGTISFINGVLVTGSNILNIPAPVLGGGQGFTRTGVVTGNISHITGNVSKTLVNFGVLATATEPRSEFPVGSLTMYRPVAITFNPQFGTPTTPNTTIVVNHVDSSAEGSAGLPIENGISEGVDVARYPNFYWNIRTTPTSVSASFKFDLELGATGFFNYDDINNVRIIRRHGTVADVTNQWLLQGDASLYDNEVSGGVPTIINRDATAGLRYGGAIFTIGMKTNLTVENPIADMTFSGTNEPITVLLSDVFGGNLGELTYTVQSSNSNVATGVISGDTLTLKATDPGEVGSAIITVTATDGIGNSSIPTSFTIERTAVGIDEIIPTEFSIDQNYPNRFNPTTTIKYGLKIESNVTVEIFNVLGEVVTKLVNDVKQAGFHYAHFNAAQLPSGMYIYRIKAVAIDGSESFVEVKKMMLMK